MISFSVCEEFEKDFKQLFKAYPSLKSDFDDFKKILEITPIPLHTERISNLWKDVVLPVYKVRRFVCTTLKSNSKLRIIYIYDDTKQEIQFIQFLEMYTKSDKDNEDRKRIDKYAKWKTSLSE